MNNDYVNPNQIRGKMANLRSNSGDQKGNQPIKATTIPKNARASELEEDEFVDLDDDF